MAVGVTVNPIPNARTDAATLRSRAWNAFNVFLQGSRSRRVSWVCVDPLARVAPASQTHVDEPRPVSRALGNATYGQSPKCPIGELAANGRYLVAVHRLS